MNPVLVRLQSEFPSFQVPQEQLLAVETGEGTPLVDPSFYSTILPKHRLLSVDYQVLRQQLVASLASGADEATIRETLRALALLAYHLEKLYKVYLDVPREAAQMRLDRSLYQEILETMDNYGQPSQITQEHPAIGFTPHVREATLYANWFRLILARNKRILDVLADTLTTSPFSKGMKEVNVYANPIFAYLAWIFFLPRFIVNLSLIIKHTFCTDNMTPEEASLGWQVRLSAQLHRRGFDLGNDFLSVTVGIINACVLVGALAPFALYVTLACMALDVVIAAINTHVRLSQLQELREKYQGMPDSPEVQAHLVHLDKRIHAEKVALSISIISVSLILLAACCILPAFAFCPIIPLVGAIVLGTVAILSYLSHYYVNAIQPDANVEKAFRSSQSGFFATRPSQRADLLAEPSSEASSEEIPLVIEAPGLAISAQ